MTVDNTLLEAIGFRESAFEMQEYNLPMAQIIPTAEPFFFMGKGENARIGCLVQHGFTGAPKEMRWMGEYLNAQGYTVCGMRLNGHATDPEDMIRSTYRDWLLSVEDGYNLLYACCEQVFLLGLSMGGVLSLTSAAFLDVRGVVAMSTPYALPRDWRLHFTRILSEVMPYMPKGDDAPGSGWFGNAWREHVAYPANPVRSIGELNALLREMRASLPQVRVPVLLIHSHDDHYVIEDSMQSIYSALGTADKEMMWIHRSGHVMTEEPQREAVFQAAAEFIQRVSKQ